MTPDAASCSAGIAMATTTVAMARTNATVVCRKFCLSLFYILATLEAGMRPVTGRVIEEVWTKRSPDSKFVTVHTHDSNFIVLSYWETRPTAGKMNQYPIQLHYPGTEQTSPCSILVIPSAVPVLIRP